MSCNNIENSFKQKVLHIVSVNGMLHYDGLKILDAGKTYQSRVIRDMEDRKWIRIKEKNIKLYHVGQKYPEYEAYMYEGAEERIQETINKVRTTNKVVYDRAKRAGDIYALLTESGIEYIAPPSIEQGEELGKTQSFFYPSRIVKSLVEVKVDETVIKSSRAYGQIVAPGDTYILYHNEKSDLRYSGTSEMVYCNALKELMLRNYPERSLKHNAIIYTQDFNTLEKLLNPEKRRDSKGRIVRAKNFSYDIPLFDEIYLLPLTYTGAKIQELMLESDWKETLDNMVIPKDARDIPYGSSVVCDGIREENGKKVYELNFLKGNIKSLALFLKAAVHHQENSDMEFIIHAFEHQKEAIEKVIENTKCKIEMHSLKDAWQYFWED